MRRYEKFGLRREKPMRKRLRVVLDTNVLISASFRKISPFPNQIYQALKSQQFILIMSTLILEEIEDVLNRKKILKRTHMKTHKRKQFIAEITDISVLVPGKIPVEAVKADPDDDKLIAAALEGKADYVVSGDKHLLNLKKYQGIKISSPRDFVKILK